uniref:B1160F02.19 protein n=1 Tax=Oryza sativa subsp. japonica TaxID=39947 RepID=Q6MWF7_ORYSJ|nr:B1160F02.19 [Oryza sativa Japonica Group]
MDSSTTNYSTASYVGWYDPNEEVLTKPIPTPGNEFRIVQYADDTLLFLTASQKELFYLKAILNTFVSSTSLKINYNLEKVDHLSKLFGCSIVLSSLPTYYMCSLSLSKTVIESIDRARRHCLWRGSDINSSRKSLVLRERVCQLKDRGGLGVIDLRLQNNALLLKNLHKFYNRYPVPWLFALQQSAQAFQEYLAMSAADTLEHLNDESDR